MLQAAIAAGHDGGCGCGVMVSQALHAPKPLGLGVRPLRRVDNQGQRIDELLVPLGGQTLK